MRHDAITAGRLAAHAASLLVFFFLAFFPGSGPAHAGGAAALVRLLSFARQGDTVSFRFTRADPQHWMFPECREVDVAVTYERVPWNSWWPSVRTNHPTKAQTEQAAALLQEAYRKNLDISFGIMGSGLQQGGTPCSFLSRGLHVYAGAVYSFFNPV
jgi:hypothetical protein